MKRIWALKSTPEHMAKTISKSLCLSTIVSDILAQRKLQDPEKVIEFLHPTVLSLASPFCFQHMKRVIERMTLALKSQEKVLVYGDYDVDGVTSTALLYKVLTDLGFQAVAYIPHRQDEGYGLHEEAIRRAAKANVKVIITVDCGVTAVSEVTIARELNIDVIITDHHEPPELLPEAYAILNPKIADSGYPFRDLAGVGVAFKLAQVLIQSLGNGGTEFQTERNLLDLVALGTIADLVPLIGENRVFVYHGLRQMEKSRHPGLDALLEECGLKNKPLKAGQIGFMVAPRINAAGRMDSAREGLELLLTEDSARAAELARLLTKENQARQDTEKEILTEAIAMLEKEPLPRVIVLSSAHWHHGVIGIVASRLVERYYRPVFMISEEGTEAKGSARGIPGYPVLEQLKTQADLLIKFGGHSAAAGFSLLTDNIPGLKEGLNQQAKAFEESLFQEVLHIDRKVSLNEISSELLHELDQLGPFGFGNSGPILAAQGLEVYSLNAVGKERNHLKFRFGNHGEHEGIAFRLGDRISELSNSPRLDAAFSLDWNTFQGLDKVQLMIKDILPKADLVKDDYDGFLENDENQVGEQIAVAQESDDILWMNWEDFFPDAWSVEERRQIWLWDALQSESQCQPWEDNLIRKYFPSASKHKQSPSHADLNNLRVNDGLGLILGLPLSEEDFEEGIKKLHELGIYQMVVVGCQEIQEERVRKRCRHLTRDELIQFYRELRSLGHERNPFEVYLDSEMKQGMRIALEIFEELGLIRCLGGSEKITLELIPVNVKLDLDTSVRYRYSKQRYEQAISFQRAFIEKLKLRGENR